jgi:hypothetical protein
MVILTLSIFANLKNHGIQSFPNPRKKREKDGWDKGEGKFLVVRKKEKTTARKEALFRPT